MNQLRALVLPAMAVAFFNASFFVSAPLYAQEAVKCDLIFNKVQASVAADPIKVLAIVEKEVRANETCVCEIIKAAVLTSQASPELIIQIRDTALVAAPYQERIITDCIESLKTVKVRSSGKEVANVSGKNVIVDPPLEGQGDTQNTGGRDDYFVIPPDVRGIYLIQPAAAGIFLVRDREERDPRDNDNDDRRRNNPPRRPVPQSPSNATP